MYDLILAKGFPNFVDSQLLCHISLIAFQSMTDICIYIQHLLPCLATLCNPMPRAKVRGNNAWFTISLSYTVCRCKSTDSGDYDNGNILFVSCKITCTASKECPPPLHGHARCTAHGLSFVRLYGAWMTA